MKAVVLAIAFFALVAVVLSQTPSKPVWPNYFSASVSVHSNRHEARFFRWFYDLSQKKDRFDGLHRWRDEQWWAQIIVDHSHQIEYNVFHQPNVAVCVTNHVNATMPHPNLSGANYIGKAEINYVPTYHWFERDAQRGLTFQYFDTVDRRNPARIDVHNERTGQTSQWTFFEFDRAPNNPEIYTIPANVLAQCTKMD
eukprot:TRINITY_DN81_c0_g1_i2.p1 TRINITY_DN81_c0_g1~~TRINITY_DN81_c0_g1_i2.p1  ORF type:complete len:197 (-),score=37.45 TRINITY_DN81_c0_g1_i2:164-754(-)